MKIKKLTLLILSLFISSTIIESCSSDIGDTKYRNANYLYYKEEGKSGYWQKTNSNSNFKYKKGKLTYFFDNGNRFGEIEVIDSLPNRIEQFYDKDSNKLIKTVWRKADSVIKLKYENGYYKGYHSNNGILTKEGNIENNLEQGVWKKYRKNNGSLRQIIELKDGLEHGKRENYWENGKLQSVSYWEMGKQVGEGVIYFENGNLEEKNFIKKGELHGIAKEYYQNGNLKSSDKYWYGKKCDTSKTFYENGNIKKLQIINLDTISQITTGKEFRYFLSGKLQAEIDFKNFKGNGDLTIYNENGIIIEKSKKVNNKHHGNFIAYSDSGNKKLEGNMKNGFFHGIIKHYNENGSLAKSVTYDNGTAKDSITY